ncbi:MAG: hypothetical protein ACRD28_01430, partial [Acidobacteriaceae bacterium]
RQRLDSLTKHVLDSDLSNEKRSLAVAEVCQSWWTGDVKLLYVAQGLRLREKESNLLIHGTYTGLNAEGNNAEHLVAFARELQGKILLTIAARWFSSLLGAPAAVEDMKNSFQHTFLEIPLVESSQVKQLKFTNVLTGAPVFAEIVNGAFRLNVGDALGPLPAVWLLGDWDLDVKV